MINYLYLIFRHVYTIMASRPSLSMDELNKAALERFISQPLNDNMISYLVDTADNVIACDLNIALQVTEYQGRLQYTNLRAVCNTDKKLPTPKEFITQLVNSSKPPVLILMSTLVYLSRFGSKLPPMIKSVRCAAHRIFLGALIISGKNLCDSSPQNLHWAKFTYVNSEYLSFTHAEVNATESHMPRTLNGELRITKHDVYRELEYFLEPLRFEIDKEHACEMRCWEEEELYAAAALKELHVPRINARPTH
ncbi:hypothetical protein GGI42DRAFT_337316 [Trichoderma sp. SZMC 28013]